MNIKEKLKYKVIKLPTLDAFITLVDGIVRFSWAKSFQYSGFKSKTYKSYQFRLYKSLYPNKTEMQLYNEATQEKYQSHAAHNLKVIRQKAIKAFNQGR